MLQNGESERNSSLENKHKKRTVGDVLGLDNFCKVHRMDRGKTEAKEGSQAEQSQHD